MLHACIYPHNLILFIQFLQRFQGGLKIKKIEIFIHFTSQFLSSISTRILWKTCKLINKNKKPKYNFQHKLVAYVSLLVVLLCVEKLLQQIIIQILKLYNFTFSSCRSTTFTNRTRMWRRRSRQRARVLVLVFIRKVENSQMTSESESSSVISPCSLFCCLKCSKPKPSPIPRRVTDLCSEFAPRPPSNPPVPSFRSFFLLRRRPWCSLLALHAYIFQV